MDRGRGVTGMKHHPECKGPYWGGGEYGCIGRCPVQAPPRPLWPGKRKQVNP